MRDIEKSSGNVFADLGLSDSEELLAKAKLALAIAKVIKARKLTQVEAARIMGVDQPKVSLLVRGRLEGFSIERLCSFLTKLERDIEIVVKEPETKRRGHLTVSYE